MEPENVPAGSPTAARSWSRNHRQRWIVLAALLLVMGTAKLVLTAHEHGTSIDGGYYTEIAGHVRDGHGLVTNVSLYHHGYDHFPHRSPIYPLWPLLYGWAARLGPLPEVGSWLATGFYFVTLVFGYLWGARLRPAPLFPGWVPGFDGGHLVVVIFGLHAEFFRFTSLPYTEGLAYALLMATLWRAHALWQRPSWRSGAELGVWLAAVFLARPQMFVVWLAAAATFVWAITLTSRRREYTIMAASCVAVASIAVMPWYLWLRTFVLEPGLATMLRFDQARATDLLTPMQMMVSTNGAWDFVRDRAAGIPIAFAPGGKHAYAASFHAVQWALPIAMVVAGVGWARRLVNDRGTAWKQWLRDPMHANFVFVTLLAVGGLLSIHAVHKSYFLAWNFSRRQALTSAFAFVGCLWFLASHGQRVIRAVALILLAGSLTVGVAKVWTMAAAAAARPQRPYREALVQWLAGRRLAAGRPLVVAMTANEPQLLARFTPDVGYHWIYSRTTFAELEKLVHHRGIDYLLVEKTTATWKLFRHEKFVQVFALEIDKLSGFKVYRRLGVPSW